MKGELRRRDFLTGLVAVPIAGAYRNPGKVSQKTSGIKSTLKRDTIRLGIIGFGFRGEQLARACKYAHPDWISKQEKTSGRSPPSRGLPVRLWS